MTYASGQAIDNETDLVYVSGIANYASGQAIENEGLATYASGQAIENETAIATNTSNISTNTARVNYASGQAIQNETDIAYTSGIATYASGNTIVNDGLIAYASGNTANISFGSNAEGDLLYHDGTSFVRLAKGTDNYILKMNGNVPNWEAESSGGDVSAADFNYVSGVANYASGQAIENEGLATYASGQAIDNETDLVYVSGAAAYSSGVLTAGPSSGIPFYGDSGQHGAITTSDNFVFDSGNNHIILQQDGSRMEFRGSDGQKSVRIGDSDDNSTQVGQISVYVNDTTIGSFLANSSGPIIRAHVSSDNVLINNSSNTTIAKFNGSSGDQEFFIEPHGATKIGQVIKGAASQSANLQEWQASDDVVVAQLGPDGSINTSGNITASGEINVADNDRAGNGGSVRFGNNAYLASSADDEIYMGIGSQEYLSLMADRYSLRSGSKYAWSNNNAPNSAYDTALARVSAGAVSVIDGSNDYGQLYVGAATVDVQTATDVGLTVQGAASQSANLQEWQASDDVVVAQLGPDGSIASSGTISASGGVLLDNIVPSVTTNKLYNDGGTLKFNGTNVVDPYTSGVAAYASGNTIATQAVDLTAGDGLTGGGTLASDRTFAVGAGNLIDVQADQVDVDLTEAAAATIAHGDNLIFLDGGATGAASKGSTDDLAGLLAGDGLTKSNSVMAVNVDDSTIETNSDAIRVKDDGITLAKMAGLARGKIIYGDSSGDPAALALGTANQVLTSDGTDVAWADNVNAYLSGVAAYSSGNTIVNDGLIAYASGNTANIAFGSNAEGDLLYHDGTSFVRLAKGTDNYILKMNGNVPNWEAESGGGGGMTNFTLAGDGGSNQTIADGNTLTVAGGNGVTTTGAATDTVSIAVDAAQTTITSLLATDIKIGEDDQTKIDFETEDEIHFYANNVEQVYLADNIFGPQSDSDVDLGTTGVRWKDAYVDSITVTGEIDGDSLDIEGDADINGTTNLDAVDIDGNVQLDGTLTVGVDDTGQDVKFFGATSGAYALFDESEDRLHLVGVNYVQEAVPANDTPTAEDATVTLDLKKGNFHNISLGNNVTKFEFTNAKRGQRFILRITQNGSSAKTVSWSNVDSDTGGTAATVRWAGNVTPTMSTSTAHTDVYGFLCTNNAGTAFDGFIIGQDLPD